MNAHNEAKTCFDTELMQLQGCTDDVKVGGKFVFHGYDNRQHSLGKLRQPHVVASSCLRDSRNFMRVLSNRRALGCVIPRPGFLWPRGEFMQPRAHLFDHLSINTHVSKIRRVPHNLQRPCRSNRPPTGSFTSTSSSRRATAS